MEPADQVEEQLSAGLGEGEETEFIKDDEGGLESPCTDEDRICGRSRSPGISSSSRGLAESELVVD